MLARLMVLALGLSLLAGCGSPPAATPDETLPSGCPAVQIIGIRGQGQSLEANGGMGTSPPSGTRAGSPAGTSTSRTWPTGAPAEGRLGPGPDLGDLGARTVEECVTGDPVCDGGSDHSIHQKAYEEPDRVRAIAGAAADVLTR